MTPAEKRIKDLIDRWLISLDLHLHYVDLNDSAYNRVQPWPVHDRPTRWVLELAKQKASELKVVIDGRLCMGDAKFADAMELMMFLANMVGSQHVQRFIPMADPERHAQALLTEPALQKQAAGANNHANAAAPIAKTAPKPPAVNPPSTNATASSLAPTVSITSIEPTVEMPRVGQRTPVRDAHATAPPLDHTKQSAPVNRAHPPLVHPPGVDNEPTREMPRPPRMASSAMQANTKAPERAAAAPPSRGKAMPAKSEPSKPSSPAKGSMPETHRVIVSDAVRLLNWGKNWHELAESIARMADRPKLQEVRKILRTHRADIETRAAAEAPEKPEKPSKRN